MAILVVQSIGAVGAGVLVSTAPFTSTAGNTLIAVVACPNGGSEVLDDGFLVWQLAGTLILASYATHTLKMYYAPNVPGKVGHTVSALVGGATVAALSVIEVSGLALISRDQAVAAEAVSGTAHTVGPLTPSDADQILIAAGSPYDDLALPVTPATWTEQQLYAVIGAAGATQIGLLTCTKIVAAATPDSCAWTTVGASRSISQMVSFSLTLQDPGGIRAALIRPFDAVSQAGVVMPSPASGDR